MVTKSRRPRPPEAPPPPAPKVQGKRAAPTVSVAQRRAIFAAAYLVDGNGTQAAIKAGYSPLSAKVQASRLLTNVDVQAALEKGRARIVDRYEVKTDRIIRELALLGFSNMGDYGRVDADGEFIIDLSEAGRDQFAAIHSIKSKRTVRHVGETTIEDYTTELKLSAKREALVDLGKITGLFKDGGEVLQPVRFIVQWGNGPRPEPYDDEEAAA